MLFSHPVFAFSHAAQMIKSVSYTHLHIFLSVQIVRKISRPVQLFAGICDHVADVLHFQPRLALFEFGALFQAQRVHGDIFGGKAHGLVDAVRKFRERFARKSRNEIEVDEKPEFRTHLIGAVNVRRGVPARCV